jgi:poly-gamma-glutamate synthesis protein (capsule biosynthesis protein)
VPKKYPVTKQYHSVVKLTYKKWRVVNRISLIIEYNTETQSVKHIPIVQEDNKPKVKELSGFLKRLVLLWVLFLTETYKVPSNLYNIIENVNSTVVCKLWNFQIFIFYIRQRGFKYCINNSMRFIQQILNKV